MVSVNKTAHKKTKPKNIQQLAKVVKRKKVKPSKDIDSEVQESTTKVVRAQSDYVQTTKKTKYVMPSKSITEDIVNSCLKALEQLAVSYKKKNTILDDESPIFAEINCIKIQNSNGNVKFILPNNTVATTGEVCLVTPDLKKGRKVDHEPTVDHWEELLQKAGVKCVKTVLPMRQLRVEYDQYELKRRLLTQHDFIMVDTRVLNHVSHILGKMFFKKHNMLIPVRLNEKNSLKRDIEVGLRTVMLRLNQGATSTIVIGHTSMSKNALRENMLSLVKQLKEKYPGGEANIRSIFLKLPLSLALPLYVTLRPSSSVVPPKLKRKKAKTFTTLEGELSTKPGRMVRVAPDGTVQLKKLCFQRNRKQDAKDHDEEKEESEEEQEII